MTCSCGRPTAGQELCPRCGETLAYALANIAAYWADAEPRDHRQLGGGTAAKTVDGRLVGGVATMPATQTRYDAWATVVAWTRVVMQDQPTRPGPTCDGPCLHVSCADTRRRARPKHTVPSMVRYLARNHHWMLTRPWVPVMLDELLNVEHRLRRLVDIPATTWYAGRCNTPDLLTGNTCTAELYAQEGRTTITCPACDTTHDVHHRRDVLLNEAQDHLVTATHAAQALVAWTDYDGTENKLADRIRKWRDRGRLDVHDVTSLHGRDRHLYRLGDIQALLIEHAQAQQATRV